MSKLQEIYEGYKNLIFKDPNVEEYALKRLDICSTCTDISNYPDNINDTSYCKLCSCILKAKSRSPKASCPKKLWSSIE